MEGIFSAGGDTAQKAQTGTVDTTDFHSAPATMGGAIRVERSVLKYLSVGLRVSAGIATPLESQLYAPTAQLLSIADVGADILIRTDAVLRGVLPIGSFGEVYLSLPIGASIQLVNSDWDTVLPTLYSDVSSSSVGTGVGFNVSLLVGVQWLVSGPLGVFLELGWMHERYSVSVTHELSTAQVLTEEFTREANQFAINIGLVFAL